MVTEVKKIISERLGEHYYDIKHKSGLRVFVFPKELSTCYGVFGVKFGAVDREFTDENGNLVKLPAGTAHFLEHKMFENADKTNSDERFAALGGDDNAYTSYSTTRYLFSTTENEEECLRELVRMVTKPYFTKKTVAKEQGIIAREVVMGEDNPWYCGSENMLGGLYQKSYLRDTIAGTLDSIKEIDEKVLYSAYENFYTADNMALSVCGKLTPETVIEVLDTELFGWNTKNAAKREVPAEPKEIARKYSEKRMNVSRPIFFLGIKDSIEGLDAAERALRRAGMSVLINIMFSSSGEFYNQMLEEKLISPSFSFGYTMSRDCAYALFSGETDHPEEVAKRIDQKLRETGGSGISSDDFERCRRVAGASCIRLFDSSEEIADDVLMNAWFSGTEPFSVLQTVESLTVGYVEKLLGEILECGQTLSVIKPIE